MTVTAFPTEGKCLGGIFCSVNWIFFFRGVDDGPLMRMETICDPRRSICSTMGKALLLVAKCYSKVTACSGPVNQRKVAVGFGFSSAVSGSILTHSSVFRAYR